jgi:hypothetical protein
VRLAVGLLREEAGDGPTRDRPSHIEFRICEENGMSLKFESGVILSISVPQAIILFPEFAICNPPMIDTEQKASMLEAQGCNGPYQTGSISSIPRSETECST